MIKHISWGIGCLLLVSCNSSKEEKTDAKKGSKMAVEVYTIETSDVPIRIDVPGTIIPSEEVDLYSEISGRVQKINFEEGRKVRKGELLIQMDVDILQAQKKKLDVDLSLAKKDEARKKTLFDANGLSQEEYEKASANLASTQAAIDLINVQISKAQIRAPFSGTVGLRHISEGAYITPSTLITSIIQDDVVKVEFSIAEIYASAVKMGQDIVFRTQKDSTDYHGKVFAFQPFINADTRMLTIRATLKNDGRFIAGSFVSVNYDLGTEDNAMMIPTESIIPVLKGQKIWVIRSGSVHEIPVELGIRTADKVQVMGDIKPGDTVLVSGLLAVKEGMPVTIKKN